LKIMTGYQRHAEYMHRLTLRTKHKMKSINVSYALNMSVIRNTFPELSRLATWSTQLSIQ
jgi:hypothetical protein